MAPGPILSDQYHCNRCQYDIPKVWLKNIVGFHVISAAYYWPIVPWCDRDVIVLLYPRTVAKTLLSEIK